LISIAKEVAVFTLNEGDALRSAVGKKEVQKIKEVGKLFIEKATQLGKLTKEEAERLFDVMKKAGRYSFNKSVVNDTTTITKDGSCKKIKELKIGDEIESPYGYTKVIDKYKHGVQEVYEVELDNGKKITCTLSHKFLCDDGRIIPLFQILIEKRKILCKE